MKLISRVLRGFERVFPTGGSVSQPVGIDNGALIQPVADVYSQARYNLLALDPKFGRFDGWTSLSQQVSVPAGAGNVGGTNINPFNDGSSPAGLRAPDAVLADPNGWAFWIVAGSVVARAAAGGSFDDLGAANMQSFTGAPVSVPLGGALGTEFFIGSVSTTVQQFSPNSATEVVITNQLSGFTPFPAFGAISMLGRISDASPGLQGVTYDFNVLGRYLPRGVPFR